ncbi:helix-turn-helix domain-containing protein [Streptomyces hydrogenans]|uniref:helix-turn-helix domain-containing protein n=1 Tax=Streptomyces hydrogenans TaxID=1873719 RepID=UPI003D71BB17
MRHNDQGGRTVRIRGARVRELRRARGFRTQRLLAAALGCARSTVSTWEASKGLPRPATLARLASLLGVPPRDLIEEANGPTLKGLRTAKGLRGVDMAKALRVTASTYCDVERSRQRIPAHWWPVLARVLGKPEETVRALLGSA